MSCVRDLSCLNRPVSGRHCAHLSMATYIYDSSVRFFSYWAFYFYSRFSHTEDAECAIAG